MRVKMCWMVTLPTGGSAGGSCSSGLARLMSEPNTTTLRGGDMAPAAARVGGGELRIVMLSRPGVLADETTFEGDHDSSPAAVRVRNDG